MHGSRFYESENKHEVAIHENKYAQGRPKGKGNTSVTDILEPNKISNAAWERDMVPDRE